MGWIFYMTFVMIIGQIAKVSVVIPIMVWDGGIQESQKKAIMVDKSFVIT